MWTNLPFLVKNSTNSKFRKCLLFLVFQYKLLLNLLFQSLLFRKRIQQSENWSYGTSVSQLLRQSPEKCSLFLFCSIKCFQSLEQKLSFSEILINKLNNIFGIKECRTRQKFSEVLKRVLFWDICTFWWPHIELGNCVFVKFSILQNSSLELKTLMGSVVSLCCCMTTIHVDNATRLNFQFFTQFCFLVTKSISLTVETKRNMMNKVNFQTSCFLIRWFFPFE